VAELFWVVQLAEKCRNSLRFEGVRLFSRAVTPTFSMPVLAAEVHGMQSEDFFCASYVANE